MEFNGRHHNADIKARDRFLAPPGRQMDRWEQEQLFEEDVRTVLQMLRPHRHERLLGWSEHRTGGKDFRVTVSWSDRAAATAGEGPLVVPRMADVIESLLVGSAKHQDELLPGEEFALYRDVLHEVHRRLDEMQACYE
jgi:hypothetical protein